MSDEMNAVPNIDAEGKTTATVETAPEKPMVEKAAVPNAPAEVGGRDEVEAPVLERAANDDHYKTADVVQIQEENPWVKDQQTTELATFNGQEIDIVELEDEKTLALMAEKEGELTEIDLDANALAELEDENALALAEEQNGELAELDANERLPDTLGSAEPMSPEQASASLAAEQAGANVTKAAQKAETAQKAAVSAQKAAVADTKKVHAVRSVEINDTRVNFSDAGDVAEYVAPKGSEMRNEGIVNNTVADAQKSGLDQKDAERAAMSQVAQGNIGSLDGTGNDRMNETQDRSRVKEVARAGAAGGVQAAQNAANKYANVEIKEQTQRSEEIQAGEKAVNSMESSSQNMADLSGIDANNAAGIEDVGEIEAIAGDLESAAALPEMNQMESLEGADHGSNDPLALAAQEELISAMDEQVLAIEAANDIEKPLALEQEKGIEFATLEEEIEHDPQLAIESGRSR